jgi:hypothetical protein
MKTTSRSLIRPSAPLLALCLSIGLAPLGSALAEIEPAAKTLTQAVAAKLAAAKTLRLTAKHVLDPSLGVGARLEKGPLQMTVKRPNQFYVLQQAANETREIAYDGKTFCIMHPQLKHHACAPIKAGSIEQVADLIDQRFGFRPPVAELLSEDMAGQMFLHVTSARITGTEWVGWTRCEKIHFEQDGMTADLWVGVKDKLPRRYLLTFTSLKGHPTWDIRLSKWELNAAVDEKLFSKKPAADSSAIPMLKSR